MIIFTTGLGSPVGNPIAPVIKITGNPQTFQKMKDNMDFDASDVIKGNRTIERGGGVAYERTVKCGRWKKDSG